MKRIKLLLLTAFNILAINLPAQSERTLEAPIKSVVVYQHGAQINREVTTNLPAGKVTLVFDSLSPYIFEQSIQVEAPVGVLIEAVYHQLDYLGELPLSGQVDRATAEQEALIDSIKLLQHYGKVYSEEKQMILANQKIGGDQGVAIDELEQAAAFYRSRLRDIERQIFANQASIKTLQKRLVQLSRQLLEMNAKKEAPSGEIRVILSVEEAQRVDLKLSYVVSEAGWSPIYDIRVEDIDQPLSLTYKASIFQSTGRDWEEVSLTLSTGNPFVSNSRPEMQTYYLTFDNYYRKEPVAGLQKDFGGQVIRGTVIDNDGEALIGATVLVKGTNLGTVTDIDGSYELLLPQGGKTLVFSYVGFQSVEREVSQTREDIVLEVNAMNLEEAVVVGYGLSGRATGVDVRGGRSEPKQNYKEASLPVPVAIQKQQTSTEFTIELPYDIPSDGENYSVSITQYEVTPDYQFEAVPKLSDKAFLIAKLQNWVDYRLLDGQLNIFFKGVYQGQSALDLSTVEDELTLSIGKDEDIVIEREIGKDFSKSTFLGNNRKVTKSWVTKVKNNKGIPVQIQLMDQYPISQDGDINVQVENVSEGIVDKDTGEITWQLNLAAGSATSLETRYTVKYPRYRKLYIE